MCIDQYCIDAAADFGNSPQRSPSCSSPFSGVELGTERPVDAAEQPGPGAAKVLPMWEGFAALNSTTKSI